MPRVRSARFFCAERSRRNLVDPQRSCYQLRNSTPARTLYFNRQQAHSNCRSLAAECCLEFDSEPLKDIPPANPLRRPCAHSPDLMVLLIPFPFVTPTTSRPLTRPS